MPVLHIGLMKGEKMDQHEKDYQRIIKEILPCNPIPACERQDDILEPPWEVVKRIRKESDEWHHKYLDACEEIQALRMEVFELKHKHIE